MSRTICTKFYDHKRQELKANYALNPNSAVMRAVNNMALNIYGATYAEVFDIETAELFAQLKLKKSNELVIVYQAEPRDFVDPIRRTSVAALFHGFSK